MAGFNYFYTCYSTLDHDVRCITWLLTVVAHCHGLALCSSRSKWGGGGVILIKSKASRAHILRAVLYQHTVAPAGALLVPLWQLGPLSIQPKSPEILVRQMERTISVWSDQNIRDQLWRWSTLTTLVFSVGWTEMSLSIWENCCPQCRSFLSCLQEQ